jgi:UDP-N-acetylmuramate dehydrogenase
MNLLKKNKDISNLSNFRTKALCEYYFEINSEDDLVKLFDVTKFATENDLKLLFVWAWTNMLFAFDKFEGIIIKNNLTWWNYDESSRVLKSYSNELISEIAEDLEKEFKQDLWHRFIGLPGSIGWAIYGNAWCFWLETESNFVEAEILDLENGQVSTMSKIDMNFSYRTSILKEKNNKYFLIKSKFDLSEKIEKYHSDVDNIYFRENKQPKWLNCWSFFKNPNKDQSGGYLIEQVWLKGYKIWWAYFSEKHANFLMNDWTWTYKNLLDLIELAQTKIKNEFWIDLINEVRIIKN